MQMITPTATGRNSTLINIVDDIDSENAVMAASPITRPKVPASVDRRPTITIGIQLQTNEEKGASVRTTVYSVSPDNSVMKLSQQQDV
jgi:hypothetical protein